MHIQRTDESPTAIKLVISAQEPDLMPIKQEVVKRLGKNVKLPGFRAGTAPEALIEKNIDQALLQGDFLDEAMTKLYAQATKQENVRPVTRPEVTVKKFVPFTELEYEVKTNIIGEIKLPDYTKIKVVKAAVNVTDKEIEDVLKSLQTRMAEKKTVDRPAKKHDEVLIDFTGVDNNDQPIPGADGKDYPLTLGSNNFIPGFEDSLIGTKTDQEKSFDLTFPKDYGVSSLANKKVTFKVKVNKVNELIEPALDDNFAAKVGPFKSLDELKGDIKKQLTQEAERQSSIKQQDELLKTVTDKSKVEMPQAIIDQQVIYNIDELRRNLVQRGQTYEEYLKLEGKTEEELKKELEPQAQEQIKASLVLAEIAEKEQMSIQPDELKIRIAQLKGQYNDPAMQAELDKPENQRDIASRMLSEKVINLLASYSG